jgi:hypothetical protein
MERLYPSLTMRPQSLLELEASMLQFTVPKAHSTERAEFLRQRVAELQGGDVAMYELSTRDPFFAGRIAEDADLAMDLSPLRSLVEMERERARQRRAAEMRFLELKAFLISAKRRGGPHPTTQRL